MPSSKSGVLLSSVTRKLKEWLRQIVARYDMMTYDWKELDWNNTDNLREYAKANMAEGYLADAEENFLDKVFDELEQKRQENEVLREAVEGEATRKVN